LIGDRLLTNCGGSGNHKQNTAGDMDASRPIAIVHTAVSSSDQAGPSSPSQKPLFYYEIAVFDAHGTHFDLFVSRLYTAPRRGR
jgi:hypothetical protein